MCRSCFESFIRNGGTKTFVLNLGNRPPLEFKQDVLSQADAVRDWVDANWTQSFGATSQTILKTKPFEFLPLACRTLTKRRFARTRLPKLRTR
jgi:hypothetical protein